MIPIPDFESKLKKDISKFNLQLNKLETSADGKEMFSVVNDFAVKSSIGFLRDNTPKKELAKMASSSMKIMRLLPTSLFKAPQSPVADEILFLKTASKAESAASLLSLYIAAQAMVLSARKYKTDIDFVIQSCFGEDKSSKVIRDYLTKPFEPEYQIPDFLHDIIDKLDALVRDGKTREWLQQGRLCGMQKPQPKKLWGGKIINVVMANGGCAGNKMTIVIGNYNTSSNLQLVLPMIKGYTFRVNIEEEISKNNIELTKNNDSTVSLNLIIPENISSGELLFQLNDLNESSECFQFWSVFDSAILKSVGYYITAGKPVIHSFSISQKGPIYPAQFIDLTWEVENAESVHIEILPVADSPNPNELPGIQLPNSTNGTIRVPVICTKRWRGVYALYASNRNKCAKDDPVTILLESGWSEYLIGTGKADVTDSFVGLGMMGFADDLQKAVEVDMNLFSRAFIISQNANELNSTNRITIVVADIWSCTQAIKMEVITRLNANPSIVGLFNSDNVLITGTHTHSGPGGYSHYFLYNLTCGGYDQVTFDIIVNGIVLSIIKAHYNLAPGRIYKNSGYLEDCGYNRSIKAYNSNFDVANFKDATDKEMILLKFVKDNEGNGSPYPIGVLNWYAIHPTSLGQSNTKISGDNKGWASHLFEENKVNVISKSELFIAAFANSSAGDVSGNVDKRGNKIPHDSKTDIDNMKTLGEKQYFKAKELFETANEELTGSISFKYTHLDMSNITIQNNTSKRTWPAALGLSFGAGSSEDSEANTFISFLGVNFTSSIEEGKSTANLDIADTSTLGIAFTGLSIKLSNNPLAPPQPAWNLPIIDISINSKMSFGHSPKPIMFPLGRCTPFPLVPNIVPIQLFKIGQLGICGVPAELTTMCGRRLKESLMDTFGSIVNSIAIAAYSNAYSGYITTEEEYNQQHYEGASTLYGPHTLAAYIQEFSTLAKAIVSESDVISGKPAEVKYVELKQRGISPNQLYVINRTSADVRLRLFRFNDNKRNISFNWPQETVPANENLLFNLTGLGAPLGLAFQVQINNQNPVIYNIGNPPIIIQ